MNRRAFLHPRRLVRSAGQVAGVVSATTPPVVPDADVALLRFSRRAMATTFELVLPFGTPNAWDMGEVVFDLLDALESQITVYRDTSEVANINRTAPVAPVVVEPRLFELLETAARITAETDGAFDVTAGSRCCDCGTGRWELRRPPSGTWNTMAVSSATSSIRAPAGPRRRWPAPVSSPRPPPRPTPSPPRFSSSASRRLWPIARNTRKS